MTLASTVVVSISNERKIPNQEWYSQTCQVYLSVAFISSLPTC